MDNSKILGIEGCGRLLWRFSVPIMINMAIGSIYNIVDRIFVGQAAGMLGISATTLIRPIFIVTLAFSLFIGIGASVTVSIKLGENKKIQAEQVLGNAVFLSIFTSGIIAVLGISFENGLLELLGASEKVMPIAKQFITIILIGTAFQIISFALHGIIRAEGNPKMAMAAMLSGTLLNIILNPLFIFSFNLGAAGSALATVVSHSLVSIWMISYFTGKKSVLKLKLMNIVPGIDIIKNIAIIGAAPFLFHMTSSVTAIVLNKTLSAYGGDEAIAAMGIIHTVIMLILMPVIGINQGSQPILGYNFGAGDYSRVKRTLGLAVLIGTYLATIGFILLKMFQRDILYIFNINNRELYNMCSVGLGITALSFPVAGIRSISYFQSVGNAKIATILSLSNKILFQLPLLFILPNFYKLNGVWAAGVAAEFLTAILTTIFLLKELKRMKDRKAAVKLALS